MSKLFAHIVVFLLVPCLLMDPAWASSHSVSLSRFDSAAELLGHEALAARFLSRYPFKPAAKIATLIFLSMVPAFRADEPLDQKKMLKMFKSEKDRETLLKEFKGQKSEADFLEMLRKTPPDRETLIEFRKLMEDHHFLGYQIKEVNEIIKEIPATKVTKPQKKTAVQTPPAFVQPISKTPALPDSLAEKAPPPDATNKKPIEEGETPPIPSGEKPVTVIGAPPASEITRVPASQVTEEKDQEKSLSQHAVQIKGRWTSLKSFFRSWSWKGFLLWGGGLAVLAFALSYIWEFFFSERSGHGRGGKGFKGGYPMLLIGALAGSLFTHFNSTATSQHSALRQGA